MKNWRPDGWDKDRILTDKWWDECDGLDSVGFAEEAVEAGADAMLEGLKKQGVTLSIADQKIDVPGFIIVFIPEEIK